MPYASLSLAAAMRGATTSPPYRRGSFSISSSPFALFLNKQLPQQQQQQHSHHHHRLRYYYTNTDIMKRDDPYQQLGLQWGDGATSAQIREAYRRKAAELHPDVNRADPPSVALRKFQDLQRAYQTLLKVHSHAAGSGDAALLSEQYAEWSVSVWRNGDRIAIDRTDVAGLKRQRPKPSPAATASSTRHAGHLLGHPDGSGRTNAQRRGEYLTAGGGNTEGTTSSRGTSKSVSSSVGRGLNKWVQPKAFVPWNGIIKVGSARVRRKDEDNSGT